MNKIVLKQAPVISHKLSEIGANVTARLDELNIENLVATEETVKALKNLRAELNKELKDYEEQRKAVKAAVNAPFNDFEAIYKAEISEKYNVAVNTLKSKIESVELKIKEEKRNDIVAYFDELTASENIDFVNFDNVGIEVNLSASVKSLKDACISFIDRVKSDLALIDTQEHKAEILAEYKTYLNVSKAIVTVTDRKAREKAEVEILAKIEAEKASYNVAYVAEQPKQPEVLQAPKADEPKRTAAFKVTGTECQLKALGQYMRENGLIYSNI